MGLNPWTEAVISYNHMCLSVSASAHKSGRAVALFAISNWSVQGFHMASGTDPPISSPPEAKLSADKIIEQQLGRVRRHIRFTDLVAGLMILVAAVVAFLTVAALVDHWVIGLGTVARWLAFLTLLAGAAWHLSLNVIPLLLRRINPAYAAQTIERGEPSLKNSLLNYLLLRREKEGVAGLIYHAVQQRPAAHGPPSPHPECRLQGSSCPIG